MLIFANVVGLAIGFVLLIRGADRFVGHAGTLATRLGIAPVVVGSTIVALGTSAPEIAITLTSVREAANDLVVANALGSNIINTLVILGATALVATIPMRRRTLVVELPLVLGSTALLLALCLHDGELGRADALVLLALLAAYLFHTVRTSQRAPRDGQAVQAAEPVTGSGRRVVLRLVACAAVIFLGGQLVVKAATNLALELGLSDRVVGLTVVALGTSLPELVTSVAAARRGQTDLALGNVVGSSILNVLFVLGLAGLMAPVPVSGELLRDGMVALGSAVLLLLVCVRRRAVGRAGGITLLAGYATYLTHLLGA